MSDVAVDLTNLAPAVNDRAVLDELRASLPARPEPAAAPVGPGAVEATVGGVR